MWRNRFIELAVVLGLTSVSRADGLSGLLQHSEGAYDGYTLFCPITSTKTFLIDNDGRVVKSWTSSYTPGLSAYLLSNGHLLRTARVDDKGDRFSTGGRGGRLEEYDWNGDLVWSFDYANDAVMQHHDIEPLPNGNALMIAWEHISTEEAIAAGRDPRTVGSDGLWSDQIVEVKPTGSSTAEVVWKWRMWDHLIQELDPAKPNYGRVVDHPEKLNLNFKPPRGRRVENPDWTHFNSIDYHPELDQILVSCRSTSEVFVIDHSTTTAEASGHKGGRRGKGGDILYRWGNPATYHAGSATDQRLFAQHDAQWIEHDAPGAVSILIFNNGLGRPAGRFSSVEEIVPSIDVKGRYVRVVGEPFGPSEAEWTYTADEPMDFYSGYVSGAQRLANGNTLVACGARGWLFEVTSDGELVWQYVIPTSLGSNTSW